MNIQTNKYVLSVKLYITSQLKLVSLYQASYLNAWGSTWKKRQKWESEMVNDFKETPSSRHNKADTHVLANRACNSTHKSRASSNKLKSHGEREVDTKSHFLLRNYLQRIATLKGKINFYPWATLGILTTTHRASHMARSRWTIQNKLHVFVGFFWYFLGGASWCFCFYLFCNLREWENTKSGRKGGAKTERNWGGERTWLKCVV